MRKVYHCTAAGCGALTDHPKGYADGRKHCPRCGRPAVRLKGTEGRRADQQKHRDRLLGND